MKKVLGKTMFAVLALGVMVYAAMMFAGCGSDSTSAAPPDQYTGTVYVAGHGGHISKAALSIDVSQDPPITASLTKLTVSTSKFTTSGTGTNTSQYKLHDVRLDGSKIYWSTYNVDANNKVHYGSIGIDGTGVVDNSVTPPARATLPGVAPDKMPYYCASGQTKTAHMPMTMTNEAYITVIKKDGSGTTDVFLDTIHAGKDYKFLHGSSNSDGSKLFVAFNLASGVTTTSMGSVTGDVTVYMLDGASVEAGTPTKTLGPVTLKGAANKTTSFRSNWSADDSMIVLAAADRMWILDSTDLSSLNGASGFAMPTGLENHDAMFTEDGKYVVLTVRGVPTSGTLTDGLLLLYSVANNDIVGTPANATSVCNGCHTAAIGETKAVLCGIDGSLAKK